MSESAHLREDKLAEEILQAQQQRSSFLKWKLIIVAVLGAAALGLGEKSEAGGHGEFRLLALIPLVCIYVDLLCSNINLRIIVIGRFFRETSPYEIFVGRNSGKFAMEDWALYFSTHIISGIVLVLGGVMLTSENLQNSVHCGMVGQLLLVVAGALGLLLGWTTQAKYTKLREFDWK